MGAEDWAILSAPGAKVDPALLAEAQAAAPRSVIDRLEVLPRKRPSNPWCAICGDTESISREHIPPRSAGNSGAGWSRTGWEWFGLSSDPKLGPKGSHFQGGRWGYSLCRSCNSRTGRLAVGYQEVAARAAGLLADLPSMEELNDSDQIKIVGCVLQRVRPGLFLRQLLSHMIVLAAQWGLSNSHPDFSSCLLDGGEAELPRDMSIGMILCPGPKSLSTGPILQLDFQRKQWRWFVELAHPPLGFEFVLAISEDPPVSPCARIDHLLRLDENTVADLELELCVGFKNHPVPGDWRTQAQIDKGLNILGQPFAMDT